jgi:hypothetical protein
MFIRRGLTFHCFYDKNLKWFSPKLYPVTLQLLHIHCTKYGKRIHSWGCCVLLLNCTQIWSKYWMDFREIAYLGVYCKSDDGFVSWFALVRHNYWFTWSSSRLQFRLTETDSAIVYNCHQTLELLYCILASCYIRFTLNICAFVHQCSTFTFYFLLFVDMFRPHTAIFRCYSIFSRSWCSVMPISAYVMEHTASTWLAPWHRQKSA